MAKLANIFSWLKFLAVYTNYVLVIKPSNIGFCKGAAICVCYFEKYINVEIKVH